MAFKTKEEEKAYNRKYYVEHAADVREYRLKNAEKIKAQQREYYLKNADKEKVRHREYRLKNRDKLLANDRERHLKNHEKELAQGRKYNIEHREPRREYARKYSKEHAADIRKYNLENTEKITARRREYRLKNRDKIKATGREYRLKNADEEKARHREYYLENSEKIKVYNRKYLDEHPREYGEVQKAHTHEHYLKNREQKLQYSVKYRREHPEQVKLAQQEYQKTPRFRARNSARTMRLKKERMAWLFDIKKDLRCSVCGQSYPNFPIIMDFHHIGGQTKEKAVGQMMTNYHSKKAILEEIAKCVPVCANCHRRLHNAEKKPETKDNARYRRYRELHFGWLVNMKRNSRCSVCGQSFPDCPSVMDFHHEGNQSKERAISTMIREKESKETILKEISKCVAICANCHRRLHESERQKRKKGSKPAPEPSIDDWLDLLEQEEHLR